MNSTNVLQAEPGKNAVLAMGERLVSRESKYYLVMQADGNLVLYWDKPGGPDPVVWSSGHRGPGEYFLALQEDGNLVVYAKIAQLGGMVTPVWNSQTHQGVFDFFWLEVTDDGNLRIHRGQAPRTSGVIWSIK